MPAKVHKSSQGSPENIITGWPQILGAIAMTL